MYSCISLTLLVAKSCYSNTFGFSTEKAELSVVNMSAKTYQLYKLGLVLFTRAPIKESKHAHYWIKYGIAIL